MPNCTWPYLDQYQSRIAVGHTTILCARPYHVSEVWKRQADVCTCIRKASVNLWYQQCTSNQCSSDSHGHMVTGGSSMSYIQASLITVTITWAWHSYTWLFQPAISQLPKLCVKITIFMQGHVMIADWFVAHFVVIMNDVMNDNMADFAHVGARLGAFFYWTRFLENNVPFDNISL